MERERKEDGVSHILVKTIVFLLTVDRLDIDLLGVRVLVVKIGLYWITDHTSAQQQSQPSPRQIIARDLRCQTHDQHTVHCTLIILRGGNV